MPIAVGERLVQPELARTFRILGEQGLKAFYEGEIGEALVKAVKDTGGSMTMEDLKNYRLDMAEPVSGTYQGYSIYSAAPPSSGGTHIIEALNILETSI